MGYVDIPKLMQPYILSLIARWHFVIPRTCDKEGELHCSDSWEIYQVVIKKWAAIADLQSIIVYCPPKSKTEVVTKSVYIIPLFNWLILTQVTGNYHVLLTTMSRTSAIVSVR